MAQSPGNIDLAGTSWDIQITFGPDTPKPVTIQSTFAFESNGTFETVGSGGKSQGNNTWKWEGSKLIMVMHNPSMGGTFTGKMVSETIMNGSMTTDYGIFLGMKNASGSDKITFKMTRK